MTNIPYTYVLKFKPTGQLYYGSRYAKDCDPSDLFKTYFSSSKNIHLLIEQYGVDAFEYKVTRTFNTKQDALRHEHRFLVRVDALNNAIFLNQSVYPNIRSTRVTERITIYKLEGGHHKTIHPSSRIPSGWSVEKPEGWVSRQCGVKTNPCSGTRRENIKNAREKTRKIKCEFCEKLSDPGNHKKSHGVNCKHNPDHDDDVWEKYREAARESIRKQKEKGTYSPPKTPRGLFTCIHCNKQSTNFGWIHRNHMNRCPDREE